jgi:drug/metabolite transporter (DMT)-like permease
MFGAYICLYLSLAALPLAETVSLFFSAPILITILSAVFLGEKVEIRSRIAYQWLFTLQSRTLFSLRFLP